MNDQDIRNDPEVAPALLLGVHMKELENKVAADRWIREDGERLIGDAESEYGRGSEEWEAAIDEANSRSVIVTTAIAAVARIRGESA